ncbi:hypothetical protein NS228_10265 [Methylobacterium indicum]|uniref:General secretion pathway protein GspC n=1 Tax=Methylobacterium indicum TaxID=1775910 RepID=A0A0J6RED9_9HYPH|nr:hypothetical protein [Methylobacterium indicum]KMO19764.1 hypothetical protein QR78_11780 [Methylobacterium indicum]KMO25514.1 hypothetical protein QR79_07160 [Methylobacterium indicum]KTS32375.1 hypothetical protein NS229_12740 [Methylobacterium indicum]KTS40611.1 hypothetical protein NS228_10265 [Methylobacterium indicum]KTS52882.1 hypothetical protein NS230_08465 [Methylobacterium indicum]
MPAAPAKPRHPALARPASPPASPIAGLIARRRAREAATERGVFGAAILLALTATGFAGYTLSQPVRPYDVREVLPATAGPFTWKRIAAPAPQPEIDLDPLITGSLPDVPPPAPSAPAPAQGLVVQAAPPQAGFVLRRAAAGQAVVEGRDGLHQVAVGSVLPGGGRVLSIRSTGAGWIVITTETIIGPTPL